MLSLEKLERGLSSDWGCHVVQGPSLPTHSAESRKALLGEARVWQFSAKMAFPYDAQLMMRISLPLPTSLSLLLLAATMPATAKVLMPLRLRVVLSFRDNKRHFIFSQRFWGRDDALPAGNVNLQMTLLRRPFCRTARTQ